MEWKKVLLISPDEIKAQGDINYNVNDAEIGASIKVCQNIYLRDVIGSSMLEKLQELVWNDMQEEGSRISDPENVAYQMLLDDYVIPVLTYKVSSEICARISLKIRNMGVVKDSDTNINAASLSDIQYMKDTYDTYYNDALNRMAEFICQNKDAFPESDFICGCGKHPKYGRTGLWLG